MKQPKSLRKSLLIAMAASLLATAPMLADDGQQGHHPGRRGEGMHGAGGPADHVYDGDEACPHRSRGRVHCGLPLPVCR